MDELGVLEPTIVLINTFSVADMAKTIIKQSIQLNPQIGRQWPTVNPLVFKCYDGYLNDIQAMVLNEQHYLTAYNQTGVDFAQGSVGAGRGMSCFGLKGGIGSAFRQVRLTHHSLYTVGALVLSNFGRLENLLIKGQNIGRRCPIRCTTVKTSGTTSCCRSGSDRIDIWSR